jgi:rhomboid-like protein
MGIALVNMAVFVLWKNPSLWKSFNRYMLMSAGHPKEFSLLGSIFSHQYPGHLFSNGLILFVAGAPVCDEIGRGNFLALFIISGIGGNLLSLYYNVLIKNFLAASLGMSSAVLGIVGAYFTLAESRHIGSETLGFDCPGWIALAPLMFYQMYMWKKAPKLLPETMGGGSDYANHVGGLFSGALIGWWLKWRADSEKKVWEEYDAVPASGEESSVPSPAVVGEVGQ